MGKVLTVLELILVFMKRHIGLAVLTPNMGLMLGTNGVSSEWN